MRTKVKSKEVSRSVVETSWISKPKLANEKPAGKTYDYKTAIGAYGM